MAFCSARVLVPPAPPSTTPAGAKARLGLLVTSSETPTPAPALRLEPVMALKRDTSGSVTHVHCHAGKVQQARAQHRPGSSNHTRGIVGDVDGTGSAGVADHGASGLDAKDPQQRRVDGTGVVQRDVVAGERQRGAAHAQQHAQRGTGVDIDGQAVATVGIARRERVGRAAAGHRGTGQAAGGQRLFAVQTKGHGSHGQADGQRQLGETGGRTGGGATVHGKLLRGSGDSVLESVYSRVGRSSDTRDGRNT
ncbi:hypothetical protein WR25_14078 [Diploscapter pachys]|uniref:Uncharacterized protein n=1 Tax=Diploscapter pachys TaxID=2018661 RepID=A0A2A2K9W6_9BILA|nr:hypothetical protein WR25_14078 [Diploscapter pachys]